MEYVTGTTAAGGCVFCEAASPDAGRDGLVVHRSRYAYVILNLYPYNNGHLMVVPCRHVATLAETEPHELSELFALTRQAEMALTEAYTPQGINVGLNLGRAAGAGVADHLHIHLVPRWVGDTNFMTVVGESRVLPEALDQSAARLRPIFERLEKGDGSLFSVS